MIERIRRWFMDGAVGRVLVTLMTVFRDDHDYWSGRVRVGRHQFEFEVSPIGRGIARFSAFLCVPEEVYDDDLAMCGASHGARAAYWRSLRAFPSASVLRSLDDPVSVTEADAKDLDTVLRTGIRELVRELRRLKPWQLYLELLRLRMPIEDGRDEDLPPDCDCMDEDGWGDGADEAELGDSPDGLVEPASGHEPVGR